MKYLNIENYLIEDLCFNDYQKIKKIKSLSESNKYQMSEALIAKLISHIKKDKSKIDFSDIDKSKGDIRYFKELEGSIKAIFNVYNKCKATNRNLPMEVNSLPITYDNLIKHTNFFKKAYSEKNEIFILLYESTVNSLIIATSYVISKWIDYVKNPMGLTEIQFRKDIKPIKNKSLLPFSIINKFNDMCRTNTLMTLNKKLNENDVNLFELDESVYDGIITALKEDNELNNLNIIRFKDAIDRNINRFKGKSDAEKDKEVENDKKTEDDKAKELETSYIKTVNKFFNNHKVVKGITLAATAVFATMVVLRTIRMATRFYYIAKEKRVEYYNQLADFLELHQSTLDETNNKTKEKQQKMVEILRKRAKKLSSDVETSDKETNKDLDRESKDTSDDVFL